jgi:putative restriction endonuclease
MAQPRPWVEEILDVMGELGGEGALDDIYGVIRSRGVMELTDSVDWRATVRRTIQQHSRASDAFSGKPGDDIFFPPRGLGDGYWAIRDYEAAVSETRSREAESAPEVQGYEGGQRLHYVNTYERKPALRAAAILIHGVICKGCAFEFGAMYGDLGRGYIEVQRGAPSAPSQRVPRSAACLAALRYDRPVFKLPQNGA